jgi:hypothetical protein
MFEKKTTLWPPAEGDSQGGQKSGKLKGNFNWPFSIEIPATAKSKDGTSFELPHTFVEKSANFNIQYLVELRIVRGKLRQDDKCVVFMILERSNQCSGIDGSAHSAFFPCSARVLLRGCDNLRTRKTAPYLVLRRIRKVGNGKPCHRFQSPVFFFQLSQST